MYRFCCRILVVAVAVLVFVAVPAANAAASFVPCNAKAVDTPAGRANVWRAALTGFTINHAELTGEQRRFLAEAITLSESLGDTSQDARAHAVFVRKARQIVERSREIFSTRELGELFSAMGPLQVWFADVVAMTPFCDCIGSGSCSMGGGPSGTCQAGCLSWDGSDGQRRDGLCGSAAME